jgi:hypothetical protein
LVLASLINETIIRSVFSKDFLSCRQFLIWGGVFAIHPCLPGFPGTPPGVGNVVCLADHFCQRTGDIQQVGRILPNLPCNTDGLGFYTFTDTGFDGFFWESVCDPKHADYVASESQDLGGMDSPVHFDYGHVTG